MIRHGVCHQGSSGYHRKPANRHVGQNDCARADGGSVADQRGTDRPVVGGFEATIGRDGPWKRIIGHTCLRANEDPIFNLEAVVQEGAVLNLHVVADDYAEIYVDILADYAVLADDHTLADLGLVPNLGPRADACGGGDNRRRVHDKALHCLKRSSFQLALELLSMLDMTLPPRVLPEGIHPTRTSKMGTKKPAIGPVS